MRRKPTYITQKSKCRKINILHTRKAPKNSCDFLPLLYQYPWGNNIKSSSLPLVKLTRGLQDEHNDMLFGTTALQHCLRSYQQKKSISIHPDYKRRVLF